MSIAVTKGKISTSGKNLTNGSEDLLTGSVFGALRYLPAEMLLLPILSGAVNLSGNSLKLDSSFSEKMTHFDFWPKLKCSEPDLVIRFGESHCIFIEAKLNSGLSGSDKKNQLMRQIKDLRKINTSKKSLIYLTMDRLKPEVVLKESAIAVYRNMKLSAEEFHEITYWLSWYEIWEKCIESQNNGDQFQQLIIQDLCEYLERMGLKHFTGFSSDTEVNPASKNLFYEDRRKS